VDPTSGRFEQGVLAAVFETGGFMQADQLVFHDIFIRISRADLVETFGHTGSRLKRQDRIMRENNGLARTITASPA
jgi:hypothetical protein